MSLPVHYLFATDEPEPPTMPEVEDRGRNFIEIKWEPCGDGGSPITDYDVERKDPKTNRWVKINKNPVTVMRYMVHSVELPQFVCIGSRSTRTLSR